MPQSRSAPPPHAPSLPRTTARTLSGWYAVLGACVFLATWAGCAAGGSANSGGSGGGSTTGGSGTGGAGGAGGHGGSGGATCNADEKLCKMKCVKLDDPATGCAPDTCDACPAPANGVAKCFTNACSLGACDPGFKNCNGLASDGCEVNVNSDPAQCGACGAPCVLANATPGCVKGACTIGSCQTGWADCNKDPKDGCEANTTDDSKNCGTCGNACASPETCENGKCGDYCPPGFANCGPIKLGCSTMLGTNQNCASCGDTCSPANATGQCAKGVCSVETCNPGFADCNMNPKDGCEVNLQNDPKNCNGCGTQCLTGPNASPVCNGGACGLTCAAGFADCDKMPADGCEVNILNNIANCGACGAPCNLPNAMPVCGGGMCSIGQCNVGFADCDKMPLDGCEVNYLGDPNNCGGCGVICAIANGVAGCSMGMCTVAACAPGWADCDKNPANGCEVNVGADPNNCGTCKNVCKLANVASDTCTGGICTIGACDPGFDDCNHLPGDGCEVPVENDPLNCGACNKQCFVAEGVAGCAMGACTVASCNPGYGDCNKSPGDGCETDLSTSDANCKTCGNNCANVCVGDVASTSCTAGVCGVATCVAPFVNLDGKCANGCECDASAIGTCNAPISINPGSLSPGNSTSYTGNIATGVANANGQFETFLTMTFTGNGSQSYHPHILMTVGGGEFLFDVMGACGVFPGCSDTGATGVTEWETSFTYPAPVNGGYYNPIPAAGAGGTVIIHVYHPSKTCSSFTLTLSD